MSQALSKGFIMKNRKRKPEDKGIEVISVDGDTATIRDTKIFTFTKTRQELQDEKQKLTERLAQELSTYRAIKNAINAEIADIDYILDNMPQEVEEKPK
jgi:hypothetical protein